MLVTPQGSQTLQAGQAHKVTAEPGQPYKLMRAAASADNVIATRQEQDLQLRYDDGTSVVLEGFYTAGADGAVCSVQLPGEDAQDYLLKGDSTGGASNAEGATLVYAHGARDTLMEMAHDHSALSASLTSLGEGSTLTYLPGSPVTAAAAAPGAEFNAAALLGLFGLGAVAALGGGGGSGGAAAPAVGVTPPADSVTPVTPVTAPPSPPSPPSPVTTTTISGTIMAGPVVSGNGLLVAAYRADGTLLASGVAVDSTGKYSLSYTGNYTGPVILKVYDSSTGVDYFDEATAAGKSLNGALHAVLWVAEAGQSLTANITPLTELAALEIGLTPAPSGGPSLALGSSLASVAGINNSVAKFFGLTTGTDQIIDLLAIPVVNTDGTTQATSNSYGKILAVISGAEAQRNQTTDTILTTLSTGLMISSTSASFTANAAGLTAKALLQDGASRALQGQTVTVNEVSALVSQLITSHDAGAGPQVLVFTDKINFKQGDTATVYFQLSAVSADFTGANITVTGGTLSALTQDVPGSTLYKATFTPAGTQSLSAAASISVAANVFHDASGAVNQASVVMVPTGDTLAPQVTITNDQISAVANGAITYTFTFSEAVTGFTSGGVVVGGGSKGVFTAVSATTYTLIVQPAAGTEGNLTVDVAAGAANDLVGNLSGAAVQSVQVIDTLAPTVAITGTPSGTVNGDVLYTLTFSEAVTGFTTAGVTVGNGTKSGFTAVSATVYTVSVHPGAGLEANLTLDIAAGAAHDAAGNLSTAPSQFVQPIDTKSPTVTITDNAPGTAVGAVTYSFTFSEAVTGFTSAQVNVGGASKGLFTAVSATSYTLVVQPPTGFEGQVTVDVAAGAALDGVNNASVAAVQSVQVIDTLAPTAPVITMTGVPKTGETKPVSITFSEAVSDFTLADLAAHGGGVVQGSFSALATTDNIHWTSSYTPPVSYEGAVTLDIAANSYTDIAGNSGAAGSSASYTLDTKAPVVVGEPSISGATASNTATANPLVIGDHVLVKVVMSEAVTVTGNPTYDIVLDDGTIRTASYDASQSQLDSSHTLVFSYTVVAGDMDATGGITAAANALHASGLIADTAGNLITNTVQAAAANAVRVDTSALTVSNASVLDQAVNVEVTSDIVLAFNRPVTANAGAHISLVNDANTASVSGYQGEATAHTIELYLNAGTVAGGITTFQAFSTSNLATGSESGTVTMNAAGLVTVNPLNDLDLSNNYHVEIAANSFQDASLQGNAVFGALTGGAYAMNFSTVSPGQATTSGSLAAAAASVHMNAAGSALTAGHLWVSLDVPSLGDSSVLKEIDLTPQDYALVMKTVQISGALGVDAGSYVALKNFAAGDVVYFDQQLAVPPTAFVDDQSAAARPSGYTGSSGGASLAYDITSTGGALQANIAFMGTPFDANATALAGQVIIA